MRLTWINGAFPRGRRAPRRSSGLSVQQPIGFCFCCGGSASGSVARETSEKKDEGTAAAARDGEEGGGGGECTLLSPRQASQKAAPLVVRVIDDRENMRARKKGPPLAASLLRGIWSGKLRRVAYTPATVTRAVPVAVTVSLSLFLFRSLFTTRNSIHRIDFRFPISD